ncbi:unnamed protein product [Nyctereutes procyonoides]|uniref:Oligosaccharyltransferase complex subunit n=1 Tax=Nyctereutes procyonoides TaxID=34880 RepID=A0A811YCY0_NYCPR|nr:unnamed protein product [Nyctereutes procyonoides]
MTLYALLVVSYFLITSITIDVLLSFLGLQSKWTINFGRTRIHLPVYNGRLRAHDPGSWGAPNIPKLNRFLLIFTGFFCVLLSFVMARVFGRMDLPGV